jgi:hypothetical protein
MDSRTLAGFLNATIFQTQIVFQNVGVYDGKLNSDWIFKCCYILNSNLVFRRWGFMMDSRTVA